MFRDDRETLCIARTVHRFIDTVGLFTEGPTAHDLKDVHLYPQHYPTLEDFDDFSARIPQKSLDKVLPIC